MAKTLTPARQELLTILTDPELHAHISTLFAPYPTATTTIPCALGMII